jgi:hypothetical protein
MPGQNSGDAPFIFAHCEDLHRLPQAALANEKSLHGGFAVDKRAGYGQIYYGMPGSGILRISPDLTTQELIELPPELRELNFHSTTLSEFDGKTRLILPANNNAMVAIVSLEGDVDFTLSRPEFEEYQDAEKLFKPTDTIANGNQLFVADGYGANYITTADLSTRQWTGIFGGKTEDPEEHGRFGTAHGFNLAPVVGHNHHSGNSHRHLSIADRLHARFEIYTQAGEYSTTYRMPANSRPCGIDYVEWNDRWFAVVGSLDDPDRSRPAPIYILDGADHSVISTIRPKEDLGIELADHIHNVVWHVHNGQLYLVCQAWNPGYYFVLELVK